MKSLIRDRSRRHKFHNYYKNLCEGTNKREQPHKEITIENWEELCTWFESNIFKAASARNKNNRKKQKVNHRGGCKSVVRHRYDQGQAHFPSPKPNMSQKDALLDGRAHK